MMQTNEETEASAPLSALPKFAAPDDAREMMQLIDFDDNFNDAVELFLSKHGIIARAFDYHVAAILGPQSSGKSTLLNMLFGTGFRTMDEASGRYQVTQGVWLGLDAPAGILAFDLEGTDSRERGDGAVNFERKIALFALALSEVLIINVWEKDVGRYNAANLDLLKTVIELDLQLFFGTGSPSAENGDSEQHPEQEEQPQLSSSKSSSLNGTGAEVAGSPTGGEHHRMHKTRLLFVLRDHVSSPFETLCNTLRADVDKIWNSIAKPERARDIPITDLFDLDFFSLPHKVLMAQDFAAKGAELRRRFHDGDLFRDEYRSGITADGFPSYAKSVWETIRANRELDIPSQKEMLAHVRCEQLVRDALDIWNTGVDPARKKLAEANALSSSAAVDAGDVLAQSLVPDMLAACNTALEEYRSSAYRYSKTVAKLKEADLSQRIAADARSLLDSQLSVASDLALRSARDLLPGSSTGGTASSIGTRGSRDLSAAPWRGWGRGADGARDKALAGFDEAGGKVDSAELGLEEGHPLDFMSGMLEAERARLEQRLTDELGRADNEVRAAARANAVQTFRDGLKGPLTAVLDAADSNVWERASEVADASWEATERVARESFGADGVGLDEEAVEAVVEDELKPACYEAALSDARDAVGSPSNMLMRMTKRFDDAFRFDERGVPRHFGAAEDIEAVFVSARAKGEELVDLLGEVRLGGKLARLREGAREVRAEVSRRCVVVDGSGRIDLVEKLKRQAGVVFIEAKRAQEAAKITTKVPVWLFAVLLILGWNEFMAVLRNPILMFLTVLVAPVAYMAYVLDAPTVLGPAIAATVNPMLEQARGSLLQMLQPPNNGGQNNTINNNNINYNATMQAPQPAVSASSSTGSVTQASDAGLESSGSTEAGVRS